MPGFYFVHFVMSEWDNAGDMSTLSNVNETLLEELKGIPWMDQSESELASSWNGGDQLDARMVISATMNTIVSS